MRRLPLGLVALVVLVGRSVPSAAETDTERRLRLLEETVRQQMDEIKRLRGEIEQQKAIGQATQKQAEQAQEQAKAVETTQKAWTAPDWLKRVTLFGDMRTRFEGFYHQPHQASEVVTAEN